MRFYNKYMDQLDRTDQITEIEKFIKEANTLSEKIKTTRILDPDDIGVEASIEELLVAADALSRRINDS